VPYVSTVLGPDGGPIVAATDWMKALPDMVARWLPSYYVSLGTDGFGRSDTREALRTLFEIDPPHIAAAALAELGRCGAMPAAKVAKAIAALDVDPGEAGSGRPLTSRGPQPRAGRRQSRRPGSGAPARGRVSRRRRPGAIFGDQASLAYGRSVSSPLRARHAQRGRDGSGV